MEQKAVTKKGKEGERGERRDREGVPNGYKKAVQDFGQSQASTTYVSQGTNKGSTFVTSDLADEVGEERGRLADLARLARLLD